MEVSRLRKSIAVLLVISAIFLFITSCSNRANPKIQPKVKEDTKSVLSGTAKIETKELKSRSDIFEVDIKIPQIVGLKNQQLKNKINEGLREDALEEKRELEEEAKEEAKRCNKKGKEFRPFFIKGNYEVKHNKNNILSLYITYLKYTGGAHPITEADSFNINTKSGKKLKLKDFFKQNQDYKKF